MDKKPPENKRGRRPGPGRPKGMPNKLTAEAKQMLIEALDKAGGVDYLVRQAHENPRAFLTLVAKLIPNQHVGESGGPIRIVLDATDQAA